MEAQRRQHPTTQFRHRRSGQPQLRQTSHSNVSLAWRRTRRARRRGCPRRLAETIVSESFGPAATTIPPLSLPAEENHPDSQPGGSQSSQHGTAPSESTALLLMRTGEISPTPQPSLSVSLSLCIATAAVVCQCHLKSQKVPTRWHSPSTASSCGSKLPNDRKLYASTPVLHQNRLKHRDGNPIDTCQAVSHVALV